MNNTEMPLPPCTSFCQNSDNSNGICRACMEREKTAYGILLNIAKRMTSDSCIDYPQWLFTLIEEAIKIGDTSAAITAPVERIEGKIKKLLREFSTQKLSSEMDGDDLYSADFQGAYDIFINKSRAHLKLQGGE